MASIPTRKQQLKSSVHSILDQVDILCIYLNNYQTVPSYLFHDKIRIYRSQAHGDLADTGKFYPLQFYDNAYYFTLDDDLLYPRNYIETLTQKVDVYERRAFICVHGNILTHERLTSYYQDKKGVHYAKALPSDKQVDIPGTGTLAFHSQLYQPNIQDFPRRFMTDIWMFKIAYMRDIDVIAIARSKQWLQSLLVKPDSHAIYNRFHQQDALPTKIINQIRKEKINASCH